MVRYLVVKIDGKFSLDVIVITGGEPLMWNMGPLTKELKNIVDSLGASSMSDIGRVMGKAMGLLKGKADGSLISKITKELLS